MISRLLTAGILSSLALVIIFGIMAMLLHENYDHKVKEESTNVVEEDCRVIVEKIKDLRFRSAGGKCQYANECEIVGQACTAMPKAEAKKANMEFDRLMNKAKDLNCEGQYLICEFVFAECKENICVVESGLLGEPAVPKLK